MHILPASSKMQEGFKEMMKDPVAYEAWFRVIEKQTGCNLMVYTDENNLQDATPIKNYIDSLKSDKYVHTR